MRWVCVVVVAMLGLGAPAAGAAAQVPRIGYLASNNATPAWRDAFTRGMKELGYVENRTVIIDRRSADGEANRLPGLAVELVGLRPQVIVSSGSGPSLAAKNATATIPIVVAYANDPVALGLVASLARPGGNITGLSSLATGLIGKRLELLTEAIPGLTRVGALYNPVSESNQINLQELRSAAARMGITLDLYEITRVEAIDGAVVSAATRGGGLAVLNTGLLNAHRSTIVDATARYKVPAIYFDTEFANAGGLLSYGPNVADLHHRAALLVDKILKGAKPRDLPFEQPSNFELVINLKAAKALGVTIPQSLLVRADRLIE